ncbi:MAG: peptidylprolyl isomerase [Faecousia sp.]
MLSQLLTGCGKKSAGKEETTVPPAAETTQATVPATVPADGNPGDVTCKGSYTADSVNSGAVVATLGDRVLTNGQLQVYYWMEVASYRQAGHETAPDFALPLDTQPCEIDGSVASWQQYFLQRALNTWHSAQALALQSVDEGIPTEEAYQPNLKNHETYMSGKPATAYLYGYNKNYRVNTLHQQYLDDIPQMLSALAEENGFADVSALAADIAGASAEDLTACAELYNRGYMYDTSLSYYIAPTEEEVEAWFAENEAAYAEAGITRDSGKLVDIRHILLIPQAEEGGETVSIAQDGTVTCSEALWEACMASARELVEDYEKALKEDSLRSNKSTQDAIFADFANKHSMDTGSALDGGLYQKLRKGQLTPVLDAWCFDDERRSGDVEIIRTDVGCHVVFFKGSTDIWYDTAREDLIAWMGGEKIAQAREKYPAEIDYSAISLGTAVQTAPVTASDLLYPDVGHQRYPEAQLYLQQDYPTTMYGAYKITTHGCGITTMSMLATYMSDTELTPPIMCERYGGYCYQNGTDGSLFSVTPAQMGFYLKEKTFEWRTARDAMREGYVVVCVQTKGFWTRGGHYLLLEKMFEDDKIQVRDSNIYNYGKLEGHKTDVFDFATVVPSGTCYWIFENKVVTIPACARCGDPAGEGAPEAMFRSDYLCEKCDAALLRRNTYLACSGNSAIS